MNQIISAIASGFPDKAFSILKKIDRTLSINQCLKLIEKFVIHDVDDIFSWLIFDSSYRFDLINVDFRHYFAISIDNLSKNIFTILVMKDLIDVNYCDYSILRFACTHGIVEVFKKISLNYPTSVRGCQNDLLIYAAHSENMEIVEPLLFINHFNDNDVKNIIIYAIKYNRMLLFEKLLTNKSIDINKFVCIVIDNACKYNRQEIIKMLLLDKKFDPSTQNDASIVIASNICRNHNSIIIKYLLSDERVDPSARNNLSIRVASNCGSDKIIKLLMSRKEVDPSMTCNEAIQTAVGNGHAKVVKLLLRDNRVDPSEGIMKPIVLASYLGHTNIVKMLLNDKRVDPSVNDNQAMSNAVFRKHVEIIELLKEYNKKT